MNNKTNLLGERHNPFTFLLSKIFRKKYTNHYTIQNDFHRKKYEPLHHSERFSSKMIVYLRVWLSQYFHGTEQGMNSTD